MARWAKSLFSKLQILVGFNMCELGKAVAVLGVPSGPKVNNPKGS